MTYSIVARDPSTGELGAATQSRYFAVGSVVPWAEPGVGAVATQSFAEVSYGPKGLALMRSGASAQDALAALRAEDDAEATRQVAMVDGRGTVGVFTGDGCVAEAGSADGEGVSAQANMMERPTVWKAMVDAYAAAEGDLADRLMAALRAAEAEGGDIRGRQSAALLVVPAEGEPWSRRFDIRVDDHRDPVTELGRLLVLARAFEHASRGLDLAARWYFPEALEELERAAELAPDDDEIAFWRACMLAPNGQPMEARQEFDRVRAIESRWGRYLWRSAAAGLGPNDPEMLQALAPLEPGETP
jgi:uncharacterized Ntn-hydrolase superfamily protein